jgi:hypothetical protein
MLYKRERKKKKNPRVWWGRRKKKSKGYMGGEGKKKEIKMKEEMENGVYMYGRKKWRVEKKEEKKI